VRDWSSDVCSSDLGGDSPFLIGEWPYYLFTFELVGFALMGLIYLPMWISVNRQEKGEFTPSKTA
jgi:hypothetical protein